MWYTPKIFRLFVSKKTYDRDMSMAILKIESLKSELIRVKDKLKEMRQPCQ